MAASPARPFLSLSMTARPSLPGMELGDRVQSVCAPSPKVSKAQNKLDLSLDLCISLHGLLHQKASSYQLTLQYS